VTPNTVIGVFIALLRSCLLI